MAAWSSKRRRKERPRPPIHRARARSCYAAAVPSLGPAQVVTVPGSSGRADVPRRSRAGGARKVPARYVSTECSSRLLNEAIRAHRRGDLQLALEHYAARLREDADCLDAWLNSGSAQVRLGRARAAIEAFEHASRLVESLQVQASTRARAWRDIGVGLMTVGELLRARGALRRSVSMDPALVGSWLHLARLELESGERASAIDAARMAISLAPQGASGYLELARVAFDHTDRTETLAALGSASTLRHAPPQAELWYYLLRHHHETNPHETNPHETNGHDAASAVQALSELARRQTSVAAEADAACYLLQHMGDARLFSSARETLRFAAAAAPQNGATVELGVHHGVSLRWLRECRDGPLHGFDSFDGLPEAWVGVPRGRFTTAGQTPIDLCCQFWVGWFDEQLPRFVERHPEALALLHVDSDLYASAVSGFTHLAPLLVPGTVIIFDEYLGHRTWRHDEFLAFSEACARYGWRFEHLAANPFTGQAVVRLL